jgi:Flp pilus assembly protein TadB
MTPFVVPLTMVVLASVSWRVRPPPRRIAALYPQRQRVLPSIAWPTVRLAGTQRRRQRVLALGFPDFIDVLVLTVRAGCTPLQAFVTLAASVDPTLGDALRAVVQRVTRGERFADALVELPRQLGRIAQPLVDALAMSDRYGTPLAPILDRLADEARAQRRRNADAAARQLPVRLSFPLVGFTLPSFVLLTIVPLMAGTFSSLQALRR